MMVNKTLVIAYAGKDEEVDPPVCKTQPGIL